ncbi:hypothetical protein LJC63_05095 [Ruminococcaceae bacterium OttesenSCG-928-L11]|nr:hypothetical protein [Ruminococcaceae bacterium OttesenSCG-928-L11]
MDISSIASSLQSTLSMVVLDKAMGQDAQAMATLLSGMQTANPPAQMLSPKMGSMDIRV